MLPENKHASVRNNNKFVLLQSLQLAYSCRTLTDICFSKLTVCRVRILIRQEAPTSHYLY